jgi:quercetin dioxygenase-like cupin family protein
LTPDLNRLFEVLLVHLEPGFYSGPKPIIDPPGEKCAIVLEGSVEFQVGDEVIRLEEGDSMYYPGDSPITYRVLGDKPLKGLLVVAPPGF